MLDVNVIGTYIKDKRTELLLTQQALGELLGVSDKSVSKWESCKGIPSVDVLLPLASALSCSVTEILQGKDITDMDTDKRIEELEMKEALKMQIEDRFYFNKNGESEILYEGLIYDIDYEDLSYAILELDPQYYDSYESGYHTVLTKYSKSVRVCESLEKSDFVLLSDLLLQKIDTFDATVSSICNYTDEILSGLMEYCQYYPSAARELCWDYEQWMGFCSGESTSKILEKFVNKFLPVA